MKIVVDTNMIIAALIKDSTSRKILMSNDFYFVSPDFVLDEIYKCEKSGISKDEFELLIALIFQKVAIIAMEFYESYKDRATEIMKEDVKDIPYVACYLALKCDGIWTNDTDFEGKKGIRIFDTAELLKLVES